MFTDIVRSTDIRAACIREYGDKGNERFDQAVTRTHDEILIRLIGEHNGDIISTAGDSFFVAFRYAREGVECAVAIQQALAEAHVPVPVRAASLPPYLQIRIGLHTGAAQRTSRAGRPDYSDHTINIAARIAGSAHGEQVLVSQATWEGTGRLEGVVGHEWPGALLRGVDGEWTLVEVLWDARLSRIPLTQGAEQLCGEIPEAASGHGTCAIRHAAIVQWRPVVRAGIILAVVVLVFVATAVWERPSATLTVGSEVQGVDVILDGRERGTSTEDVLEIRGLRPGRHRVHAAHKAFGEWVGSIDVTDQGASLWILLLPGSGSLLGVRLPALLKTRGLGERPAVQPGQGPRFNVSDGDCEMLSAARLHDYWSDPVEANIGDRLGVLLYFHNATLGTTAHRTSVRVDIPRAASRVLRARGYLWSTESRFVTDTLVAGRVVGSSGLTVRLPHRGRLVYVPGSSKLVTRRGVISLPDGIATTGIGVGIGEIRGGPEHAGFVFFQVEVKGETALEIDKFARLPPTGEWFKDIRVRSGDEVEYRLRIRNSSRTSARNVVVRDVLPPRATYVPGSLRLWLVREAIHLRLPHGSSPSRISLPEFGGASGGAVDLTYRVRMAAWFPKGWSHLSNRARLLMNGVEQGWDQAAVHLYGSAKQPAK